MSERDPRVDPQIGDVLRKYYTTRTITRRAVDMVWCRDLTGNVKKDLRPWVDQFQRWAKDAEVIHRAEPPC